MELPTWIQPLDGRPKSFVVDPDLFYPVILRDMRVDPEDATRFDMEVALGIMKKLARRSVEMAELKPRGVGMELLIRGDMGRKDSWRIASFPVGVNADISHPSRTAERSKAVARMWRKLYA